MELKMKEAQFCKKLKNKIVQCQLCPHFCVIQSSFSGKCRVRKNIKGKLYSLSYGNPVSISLDPITKKPLYHYLPNTFTFSIGMAGCNLSCLWCQNWSLSQKSSEEFGDFGEINSNFKVGDKILTEFISPSSPPKKSSGFLGPKKSSERFLRNPRQTTHFSVWYKSEGFGDIKEISPKKLVDEALKSGCPSISYTYSEPFVSYEYVFEIAKLAKEKGLKNILVTNGFINKEPFEKIAHYIDAANIDLKSFKESFYNKYCGGRLKPVLDSIKRFHKSGIHIEITTLVIPELNDSSTEFENIARFIASIDKKIPWHISRFFPHYKMQDKEVTPIETLKRAEKIGMKYLEHVHIGNI